VAGRRREPRLESGRSESCPGRSQHTLSFCRTRTTSRCPSTTSDLREGRGVSDQYGVRDAACPLSTRGGGGRHVRILCLPRERLDPDRHARKEPGRPTRLEKRSEIQHQPRCIEDGDGVLYNEEGGDIGIESVKCSDLAEEPVLRKVHVAHRRVRAVAPGLDDHGRPAPASLVSG
jgi:hypothetical protein